MTSSNKNKPLFVFGSQSFWRRKIFTEQCQPHLQPDLFSGFFFLAADIDEKAIRHADAEQMVTLIARAKQAELVRQLGPDAMEARDPLIFTTDQVALKDGAVFEKPVDEQECRAWLRSYSGTHVDTVAAYILLYRGVCIEHIDRTRTFFKTFDEADIDKFIAADDGACLKACGGSRLRE